MCSGIQLWLLPLALLLLCACKDDLPKPTQKGAGTIACRINGTPWVSGGTLRRGDSEYMRYTPGSQDGDFYLKGKRVKMSGNTTNTELRLYLSTLTSTGVFQLDSFPLKFGAYYDYDAKPYIYYYTDSGQHTGWVHITKLDTVNRIISGMFEFTAADRDNPSQTVRVTDGRFDMQYK